MGTISDGLLQEKPALDELCEHIIIGSKWYQLGIQLKLNVKILNSIWEERGEMCQILGHNCKDYVPQDIDLSYEDDDKQSIITENSSVTEVSGVREESLIPPAIDSIRHQLKMILILKT